MSIAGFDFGTSNSALGIINQGESVLVPLEGQNQIIPSAIFYNIEDDERRPEKIFGRKALSYYVDGYEGRLMRSLKSLLGTSLIHEKTQIGKQNVEFAQILQDFLQHAKHQAEIYAQQNLTHLVCGRPVYFIDEDEIADKKAQDFLEDLLKKIGFQQIEFVYEPVAAAMDFERTITQEHLALIVDIGGGTSDFSVIKVSPDGMKRLNRLEDILANDGVHIGGNDFDRLLNIFKVMPFLGYKSTIRGDFGNHHLDIPVGYFHDLATWHKINFLYTDAIKREFENISRKSLSPELWNRFIKIIEQRDGHRLALDVEKAKIALTTYEQYDIMLDYVEKQFCVPVTTQDLNQSLEESIQKIEQAIDKTLQQAGVTAEKINVVFLTGGGTYLPAISQMVKRKIPQADYQTGNHFGSIATGLTECAKYYFQ